MTLHNSAPSWSNLDAGLRSRLKGRLREAANEALQNNEVPIACIAFHNANGRVMAVTFNRTVSDHNALHHAEIQAIDHCCKELANERLCQISLLCSLEPCLMCSGAIIESRVAAVYYAAVSARRPALEDIYKIEASGKGLNHRPHIEQIGELKDEYTALLQNFFRARRE